MIFGATIFNRFKLANKQNSIIQEQKQKVDEAHKEITDSINYARRIQEAILPQRNILGNKDGRLIFESILNTVTA